MIARHVGADRSRSSLHQERLARAKPPIAASRTVGGIRWCTISTPIPKRACRSLCRSITAGGRLASSDQRTRNESALAAPAPVVPWMTPIRGGWRRRSAGVGRLLVQRQVHVAVNGKRQRAESIARSSPARAANPSTCASIHTPKRCCSSMAISRDRGSARLPETACVPTTEFRRARRPNVAPIFARRGRRHHPRRPRPEARRAMLARGMSGPSALCRPAAAIASADQRLPEPVALQQAQHGANRPSAQISRTARACRWWAHRGGSPASAQ